MINIIEDKLQNYIDNCKKKTQNIMILKMLD